MDLLHFLHLTRAHCVILIVSNCSLFKKVKLRGIWIPFMLVSKEVNGKHPFYYVADKYLGLLQTAFVVCYMVFAPVFGYLGDRHSRKWLLGIGIGTPPPPLSLFKYSTNPNPGEESKFKDLAQEPEISPPMSPQKK
jgi:hypothetical protein